MITAGSFWKSAADLSSTLFLSPQVRVRDAGPIAPLLHHGAHLLGLATRDARRSIQSYMDSFLGFLGFHRRCAWDVLGPVRRWTIARIGWDSQHATWMPGRFHHVAISLC